jgi:hypothetical protein
MAAMAELFGLEFESPRSEEPFSFMTCSGPTLIVSTTAQSLGGPMRVELCCGSMYPTDRVLDVHHFGYWSRDVAADIERMRPLGWTPEIWVVDGDGRPSTFAYLVKENQPRIEFVGIERYEAFADRVRFDVPVLT